jgi:hypothetical protein
MKASLVINRLKMALDADQVAGNEEIERRGAIAFLRQQGVQINMQQIVVGRNLAPPEYMERFKAILQDVVDGEGEEVH